MLCAVQLLRQALQNDSAPVPLDIAALELASIEFPGLDFEASLFRLDSIADQMRPKLGRRTRGLAFIQDLNELLFDSLQFRGNEGDYYDPRNSCLNAVLSRRLGIPISLSVVYMEVARRLDRPVYGIGLPGHFIVMYEEKGSRYFVDPFHRGQVLSLEDCYTLAKQTAGVDVRQNPSMLAPVTRRQILTRMLGNLKTIYLRGQNLGKARQVLDLLMFANPEDPEDYRLRGLIHLQQLNHRAAKADLETYIRLTPEGSERKQVEQQLLLIERWKAALN
jgi:regulator of sirC expression with transglutaminase-like and TPR domain